MGGEWARRWREGALGRFALDFVAVRQRDGWRVLGIEINLPKGGTTHPYACLRNLVPGRYDAAAGCWRAEAGGMRCYIANDNVMKPAWTGRLPAEVIGRVCEAGLQFDSITGTGVVLLMLSGLSIDGRIATVAIGRDEAEELRLSDAIPDALRT